MATWKNAVVEWDGFTDPTLGKMEGFKLEVPFDVAGKLTIWKIPACEDYPEGYWFALNTGSNSYSEAEPGCEAWKKTLLCSIRFFSAPTGEEEDEMSRSTKNVVEVIHPAVPLKQDLLNPNDYSKKEDN